MSSFRLVRGNHVLGKVTIDYQENWYFAGRFSEPTTEFETIRHLFDEYWIKEGDSGQTIWREIAEPGIRLEPLDGGESICLLSILIRGAEEVSGRRQ